MNGTWLRLLERHARRLAWLAVLGWIAYVAVAVASGRAFRPGWLVTLFLVFVAAVLLGAWVASRRRMAIREGGLPVLVKRALRQSYPQLQARDADLVERGFRQFFLACARSDGKFVAMPSKAVDAYWLAFTADARRYADWCDRTLGRVLRHAPAVRLGSDAAVNDGLRRAWFFACREEAIDPRHPSRLPLLFALDAKLGIPGGFVYSPRPRPAGSPPDTSGGGEGSITYGEDFADESIAGDADAMGGSDSGSDGGGDGGGD